MCIYIFASTKKDLPPPYPHYESVNKIAFLTPKQEQYFEGCYYVHELLATIDLNEDASPSGTALHYWKPANSMSRFLDQTLLIPSRITLDHLRYIDGFRDLGNINVPTQATPHNYLSLAAADIGINDGGPQSEPAKNLITETVAKLRSQTVPQPSVSIRIASIPIYSRSAETPLDRSSTLYWKWVKPHSIYAVRSGAWEPEIEPALESAQWEAGRGINLLVQNIPEERE